LGNHDFYRGSIAGVRRSMQALSRRSPYLRWLPAAGVVELSPGVALVGHDGWSDGRFGDWDRSTVMLNDYLLIEELAFREKADRLHELQLLGDEAALHFKRVLPEALAGHHKLIVAIHPPPFKEACWHEGRISNDDWLPHFTCKAAGDALRAAMLEHTHRR